MNLSPKVQANKKKRPLRRNRRYEPSIREKYLEMFVSQCIVCGIFLSVALIVRIIEIPQTMALRERFHETVSVSVDVAAEFRGFAAMIAAALPGSGEAETVPVGPAPAVPPSDQAPTIIEMSAPGDSNLAPGDFRIDEDILAGIHGEDIGTNILFVEEP